MENSDKMNQQMQEVMSKKPSEIMCSILDEYKVMVDNISSSHFKAYKDMIENETENKSVDVDAAVIALKEKLWKTIVQGFKKSWEDVEINKSLMQLEVSKLQTLNLEKKWRPTNVPVTEQACPKIVKELKKQKRTLERMIPCQKKEIEDLVLNVQHLRTHFKEQLLKREQILSQIKADKESLKRAEEHIKSINKDLDNN